jgi:hypothetical protein
LLVLADYKQKEGDVNMMRRFPEAEQLFSLGDFNIWKITPKGETRAGGAWSRLRYCA